MTKAEQLKATGVDFGTLLSEFLAFEISHNGHKVYGSSVEEWSGSDNDNWISEEQKSKAFFTDECYELTYVVEPGAPVKTLLACDLVSILLTFISDQNDEMVAV